MRDRFIKTIQDNNLLKKGDSVVLGVSGGPDSMSMLHLFCSIRDEWSLSLYAVHLNHGFRGPDADADAQYVEKMCKEWHVPLHSYYTKVEALAERLNTSFEDAGRKERYRLFFKVLEEQKADKIAVAQNKNDQAETVLMRLIRGAGIEGLSGIQYARQDGVIRPLLDCSRADIEAYCEAHQIEPRIDHTNSDVQYTRNKIRWEILKNMSELNPSVSDNLVRTSHLLKDDNDVLNELVEDKYSQLIQWEGSVCSIPLAEFNPMLIGIKRRLIRKCIEAQRGHLIDVAYDEIESIVKLAMRQKTNSKKIYHALTFEISYDRMLIYPGKREIEGELFELKVREMTREEFDDYTLSIDEVVIDGKKITGELSLRFRQSGDVFYPEGMVGRKKLKNFFIDEKVPREQRTNIPIICDELGIVWIVGYRQDRRYLIEEQTSKVLILQCMKLLSD